MKRPHAVSVDSAPATKSDAFQFRFLPAFIGALQYPPPFSLRDGRQDGNHHLAIGTDPVINETDGHALGVEFLYQLDHIGGIPAKTVELLH